MQTSKYQKSLYHGFLVFFPLPVLQTFHSEEAQLITDLQHLECLGGRAPSPCHAGPVPGPASPLVQQRTALLVTEAGAREGGAVSSPPSPSLERVHLEVILHGVHVTELAAIVSYAPALQ